MRATQFPRSTLSPVPGPTLLARCSHLHLANTTLDLARAPRSAGKRRMMVLEFVALVSVFAVAWAAWVVTP